MSNIDPDIIDPGKAPVPPPSPDVEPDDDAAGPDDIREPEDDVVPIEPDPEENRRDIPGDIERA